jgi:hypothetical protein
MSEAIALSEMNPTRLRKALEMCKPGDPWSLIISKYKQIHQ